MFKKYNNVLKNLLEQSQQLKCYPTSTDYYVNAKTWYEETYEAMICSRDRYRMLSIFLGGLLALALFGLILLLPLKHYYYRILTVNQVTGEVATLKELEGSTHLQSWVMTRYFINQYLQNKYTYHFEDIKRTFNFTLAMSAPAIAKAYEAELMDSNPSSPINMLGKEGYREVEIVSINQLNGNTALARFRTLTHPKEDGTTIKKEDFQAVIKWDYQNVKASLQERDLNPLGFQVTYYEVSPLFTDN